MVIFGVQRAFLIEFFNKNKMTKKEKKAAFYTKMFNHDIISLFIYLFITSKSKPIFSYSILP